MTKRIFRSILAVSVAVLLGSLVLIVGVLHGYFQGRVMAELESRTAYVAHGVELDGMRYLTEGLPAGSRVTWVDGQGNVLFDNWESTGELENHAQRQEIRQALATGTGSAARYSDTLAQKTLYYAVRLSDGTVVRVSDTQYSVWVLVLQAMQPVAFVMLLALLLALWLAGRVSRHQRHRPECSGRGQHL